MKEIISVLIRLYLWPLSLNTRLSLYAKGWLLRYTEHFAITVETIKKKYPNNKGIIVDVGAYDGDSATYFAKQFPNLHVIGFEPNPFVYAKGLNRIRKYPNIELINLGFSNHKGQRTLYLTKSQAASSLYKIKDKDEGELDQQVIIEVTSLDLYFKDEVEILLIKLDVQGAELGILQGGTKTLSKTKMILTEVQIADIYEGGCFYFEIDSYLRDHGFILHTIISKYNNQGTKYFDMLYTKQDTASHY